MSRRAAEQEIMRGLVKVNGEVADLGSRIVPGKDTVEYRGRRVEMQNLARTYILLNKPRGFVTTMSDEKGRHTVAELVADVGRRVYPVGRLDMDSDGLLLLTDDGELANKLTHPRHEIPKIYHVTVKGSVSEQKLRALGMPMTLDGYEILPVDVVPISTNDTSTTLQMTLYEGRNRQIRKMCDAVGLDVLRLCRIAIGNITLGELAPGKWRYLSSSQVEYLRSSGSKNKSK